MSMSIPARLLQGQSCMADDSRQSNLIHRWAFQVSHGLRILRTSRAWSNGFGLGPEQMLTHLNSQLLVELLQAADSKGLRLSFGGRMMLLLQTGCQCRS